MIRGYYKIISSKYIIGVLTFSFFSSLITIVFDRYTSFVLMIPIMVFVFLQMIMMISTLRPSTLKKLAGLDIREEYSVKKLSRLLDLTPHHVYALMSLMERTDSLLFIYKYKGEIYKTNPRKGTHQICLQFKENK